MAVVSHLEFEMPNFSMQEFYGAYNCYGLMRKLSELKSVSVSAGGPFRNLDSTGFKGGRKPCPKTRETAALRRGIPNASRT